MTKCRGEDRGAQIPGTSSPYRLNFLQWCQDLWVLGMEFDYPHRFGTRILMWLLDFWNICASLGDEHWQTRCNELLSSIQDGTFIDSVELDDSKRLRSMH
jgi:hypothetical protein